MGLVLFYVKDAVVAAHPKYGSETMAGCTVKWDAIVAAKLPDGSVCLHFDDGDKVANK